MKFDTPATSNPIDQLKVVGKPTDRIDGKYKTTGTAPYAYERHDVAANQAYGFVLGSGIAKGRVAAMAIEEAKASPGVLAIVTTLDTPRLGRGMLNAAYLFGGPDIQHYHQAIAVVVAETFEQARAAAHLIGVDYVREPGKFDLAVEAKSAPLVGADSGEGSGAPPVHEVGDFDGGFAAAPLKLDETYTTPDESHAMMEPHATIAAWEGDRLTLWTSNQMIAWGKGSIAKGRIAAMHLEEAKTAPGVLAIVTTLDMPRLERGKMNVASLFGGPVIQHYHQAIAVVVAETFEHARAAAYLIRVDYQPEAGKFDLATEAPNAPLVGDDSGEGSSGPPEVRVGDFEGAFEAAAVRLDESYTTP
ncbi:MAG TPA: molybdopterin cofactor-binding domain-containing protein, partial [Beijerinckiaceae bacterium]|nr:molybdopterin cofactor-binding domain-containing protein [Beijerinckiaceae bacterium]